jgi:hypothetical protein
MRIRTLITRRRLALAAVAASLATASVAAAFYSWPPDTPFNVCYDANRVVPTDQTYGQSSACPSGMTKLGWMKRGPTGPTGATGPVGLAGPAGPAGARGNPGKYDQHWVVVRAGTSSTPQAASDGANAFVYYAGVGYRYIWLGIDTSRCAISITAEDTTGANLAGPPVSVAVLRYYGYVLAESWQRNTNGTFSRVNAALNNPAYG